MGDHVQEGADEGSEEDGDPQEEAPVRKQAVRHARASPSSHIAYPIADTNSRYP